MRVQESKFPEILKSFAPVFQSVSCIKYSSKWFNVDGKGRRYGKEIESHTLWLYLRMVAEIQSTPWLMCQVISNVSRDIPADSAIEWHKILPCISKYQLKDNFDANETCLFYHLVPNIELKLIKAKITNEEGKIKITYR